MLAIRLQRVGRKGYPAYRVAVQEAQRHPSSGRVVAYVGNYNPHTKAVKFDKEKIELYLKNGAQPSPRVVKLMGEQKINLPDWVVKQGKKDKKLRNPDKLRKNQPAKPADDKQVADEPAAEAETEVKDEAAQPSASADTDVAAAADEPAATPTADEPVAEETETPAEVPGDETSGVPVEEVDKTAEPETKEKPEPKKETEVETK